jgi:rubrerythrin
MTIDMSIPVGLSVWEQEIYQHLVDHMMAEHRLIDDYERLAKTAGGHVSYLLKMIIDDEIRHHRLFGEWCNALRGDAEFRLVEPSVPDLEATTDEDEVLTCVKRFLAIEEADTKDLARLKKQLRDVKDTTLWNLLVEVMELDTQKHRKILEFLAHHPGGVVYG